MSDNEDIDELERDLALLNSNEKIKKEITINYTKPIIKWVGGKTQILEKVLSHFPRNIKNYHELFLGGGSVLLGFIENVKAGKINLTGKIYAYDYNETLINLYKNIQSKPDKIIKEIRKLINDFNNIETTIVNRNAENIEEAKTSKESYYYWIRKQFNSLEKKKKNSPLGTAYFIFLNKTGYRGVYREGPNGYNVPYGNYNKPEIINEEHLKNISDLIQEVTFIHSSFEESFKEIKDKKNDFVYLDPPYAPKDSNSFVGYTKDGFTLENHNLLFEQCKEFKFLLSNAEVELVTNSFKEKKYKTEIVECRRAINQKNPESKTNEVLIKNF